MKNNKLKVAVSAGLLGLLGFGACSPKIHRAADQTPPVQDTGTVKPAAQDQDKSTADSLIVRPIHRDDIPIRVMYGPPPSYYKNKK